MTMIILMKINIFNTESVFVIFEKGIKMRILYVDNQIGGHHLEYLKSLAISSQYDSVVILPERIDLPDSIEQYFFSENVEKKNLSGYIKLISFVKEVADSEKVDVIHFLNFDPLLKYFGVGLNKLKKYSVIVTFHHYRYSRLHDFARKRIYKCCKSGVVHTNSLLEYSNNHGIKNCVHIEYPVFKDYASINVEESRRYWHIFDDKKVLLALGGTRYNKGLDILLKALDGIDMPYHLIIAGKEDRYTEGFIKEKTENYKDKVILKLRYLTDDEVQMFIAASDIIVLPYRKIFDGASGPLGEGVILGKCIIGPDHGSLGKIISENHLGYTFSSEDSDDLANIISKALKEEFVCDSLYNSYQESISPDIFRKKYYDIYDMFTDGEDR